MKKLDILIIVLAFIFSITLITIYFVLHSNSTSVITIEYNNETICEIEEDSLTEYIHIISNGNVITVREYNFRNEVINYQELNKKIINNDINYKIHVSDDVRVISSECKNHNCMNMVLNSKVKSPIICTDGLVIKYKNNIDMDIVTGE